MVGGSGEEGGMESGGEGEGGRLVEGSREREGVTEELPPLS